MDADAVRCTSQVYVRAQDAHRILCAVGEKDLAPELLARFKHETEEKERKRKDKAEAHLNTMVKIARDEDLASQIGQDIFFDLVDHDKVPNFAPSSVAHSP
jgi:ubiquitin carboxyl-terminal hydrolase 7